MTQAATTAVTQLRFLLDQPSLAPQTALAVRVAVALETWARRARTRRALAQLDEHLLRDVGLDRRTAYIEARRKFWQG